MARYIDADKLIKTLFPIGLIDDGKYTINAKAVKYAIDNTPTADVVPREECEKWYHEYHVIKDALKQEKEYHRSTEKLAEIFKKNGFPQQFFDGMLGEVVTAEEE